MRRSSGFDRRSRESIRRVGVLEPQTFGQRIAAFLRERHPTKTAACVEADSRVGSKTTISAATVSKWLEGASSPAGPFYQRLIEIYGAELVEAVSPGASPACLREAARIAKQGRIERQLGDLQRKLSELGSGGR